MLKSLTTQRLMLVILFIALFTMAVRVPVDTDIWWHLRTGEYILSQRAIPLNDPFSLTRFGQPWIDHSWGSQIVLYGFYHLFGGNGAIASGGDVGLALYTALLATGGMVFIYLMCEGNVFLRALICIITAAAAAVFWSARPQMMSFFLSTVTLYLVHLYKYRQRDRLWLIPVIMVVWANLHAGFSVGFIFLGGTIVGECVGRLLDAQNPNVLTWPQIGRLALFSGLGYVALVINPNTVQMWTYSFRTVNITFLQQYIQEWNSPNFHGRETWPFLMLLFGLLAAAGLASRRMDWTDILLTCGTAFLSLTAGRNIAVFAVCAAPALSRQAEAVLEEHGLRLGRPIRPRGPLLAANWILLLLVILGAGAKNVLALTPREIIIAKTLVLPIGAADYLNQHEENVALPMFNSYNWGGYLLFGAPDYRVFVDGRTDLFGDDILFKWLHATQGQDWDKTFNEFGIRLAVIEHDSPLAGLLRIQTDWKEVYQDKLSSVFRKGGA
ncbi:MAG TPA: hypothetical protein VMT34_01940 [Aggregatilineales bacterium]|nr:hypothetical protein [Aggregatilineales bacterium]